MSDVAIFFVILSVVSLVSLPLFYWLHYQRVQDSLIRLIFDQSEVIANHYLSGYHFFTMKQLSFALARKDGRKIYLYAHDDAGCYVFHDLTTDNYYVGQSIHIIHRLTQHLRGKGSPDIYQAYQQGHTLVVAILQIANSPYTTLNQMEKLLIAHFDSYNHGYNETAGNGTEDLRTLKEKMLLSYTTHQKAVPRKVLLASLKSYLDLHPEDKDFKRSVKQIIKY